MRRCVSFGSRLQRIGEQRARACLVAGLELELRGPGIGFGALEPRHRLGGQRSAPAPGVRAARRAGSSRSRSAPCRRAARAWPAARATRRPASLSSALEQRLRDRAPALAVGLLRKRAADRRRPRRSCRHATPASRAPARRPGSSPRSACQRCKILARQIPLLGGQRNVRGLRGQRRIVAQPRRLRIIARGAGQIAGSSSANCAGEQRCQRILIRRRRRHLDALQRLRRDAFAARRACPTADSRRRQEARPRARRSPRRARMRRGLRICIMS